MQSEHWSDRLKEHTYQLGSALVSALSAIRARGILHGNVHKCSILVTPNRQIVFLDFAAAELEAPASETDAEMHYLCDALGAAPGCAGLMPMKESFIVIPLAQGGCRGVDSCV